jgi:hypothetical protein
MTPTNNATVVPIREAFKDHLKVSIPSGYALVNSGKLRTYKVGRNRYTTTSYIQDCINKLTTEAEGTRSGGPQ